MAPKNIKNVRDNKNLPTPKNQRTIENILDEYKIISLQLFEYSDKVQKTDEQEEAVAVKQAQLLDAQQALLIEAQAKKIENGKDVLTLFKLWKMDNIYSRDTTPSQGIVLHLQKHFEKNAA